MRAPHCCLSLDFCRFLVTFITGSKRKFGCFRGSCAANMAGPLLEFETEMFLSLFGCDGLLVVAEGMGIDRILLQFMRVYSEQGSLVLLLNTTTPEQVRSA